MREGASSTEQPLVTTGTPSPSLAALSQADLSLDIASISVHDTEARKEPRVPPPAIPGFPLAPSWSLPLQLTFLGVGDTLRPSRHVADKSFRRKKGPWR